jgi:hypothetical protein
VDLPRINFLLLAKRGEQAAHRRYQQIRGREHETDQPHAQNREQQKRQTGLVRRRILPRINRHEQKTRRKLKNPYRSLREKKERIPSFLLHLERRPLRAPG